MKYAFNTWAYGSFPTWLPSYPLEEVIRRLARIGYDGVEIGCAAPHAYPAYLDADRRRELRHLMEGEGLSAVSLLPAPGGGPGFNPASPYAAEREATVAHYRDVVDLAADLGAGLVLFIAGWQIFGTSRREAYARSRDVLKRAATHAADRGITIVIEPTAADSNLIDSPDHALELMRDVDALNVRVMFDTYHALYRDEVPADTVRAMGAHLAHVHISGAGRVAPGDDPSIDWLGLLQATKDVGFKGHLTMEIGFNARSVDPDLIARKALNHLRSLEEDLT